MILSKVTAYLRERKRASVQDMSFALAAAPDALQAMLATLERKGRVRRLPAGSACGGGCHKCAPHSVEIYEWVDAG
ncbi:FeoC-like transcriptional regulator [Candidatus Thiothrix sp. Deng01]|uniref:FeoC-like transcriptional regulator n=2 Tax=Thiothrix TaxID=1030 RepID=A0A7L6AU26_9GAMM|nr:FeoC-like transcriptional regulator [Candidatus Thiothrix sp. Deng01]MEB4591662.1 FeoC-like transcriptional regulator [Candidatus Thiothrix sp. Deng01]QLQ32610.1 MAG: FeoC-like transcriptional regulator [Candidatus Thiothrix singaporensis]